MIAMQYTIQLAADFGIEKIRDRIAARAPLFDSLPGLAHKSYLFNHQHGLYAPFYIWNSHDAARDFLLGPLFVGVTQTFGRPRVRTWNVLAYDIADPSVEPTFAVREVDSIASEDSLAELAEIEREQHRALTATPGLHSHAVALDADRWELVRYSLWRDQTCAAKPRGDSVQPYEVLHLSTPGRGNHSGEVLPLSRRA
ncbi:MAG: DUF4865 family protein [Gemmatimonas sp.]